MQKDEPLKELVEERQDTIDSIVDIRHMCLKGTDEATIALRKSGHVDFYWNCKLASSSEQSEVTGDQQDYTYKYLQIKMNFSSIIL